MSMLLVVIVNLKLFGTVLISYYRQLSENLFKHPTFIGGTCSRNETNSKYKNVKKTGKPTEIYCIHFKFTVFQIYSIYI